MPAGRGGAFEVNFLEEAVHLRRAHALAAGRGHLSDGLKSFPQPLPLQSGDEDDGRVVQVLHLLRGCLGVILRRRGAFLQGVPFVHHHDDGAVALVRVAADVGVERRHAFDGVRMSERHVGSLQVLARLDDAEFLGQQLGLAFAPDARGVDEAEAQAVALEFRVHGVARGARAAA